MFTYLPSLYFLSSLLGVAVLIAVALAVVIAVLVLKKSPWEKKVVERLDLLEKNQASSLRNFQVIHAVFEDVIRRVKGQENISRLLAEGLLDVDSRLKTSRGLLDNLSADFHELADDLSEAAQNIESAAQYASNLNLSNSLDDASGNFQSASTSVRAIASRLSGEPDADDSNNNARLAPNDVDEDV